MAFVNSVTLYAQQDSPSEYEIKAAFLFNFAKFIEWPGRSFAQGDSPIIITVVGEDPFGRDLNRVVEGKNVNGRQIVVRKCRTIEELGSSHIVFISRHSSGELPRLLRSPGRESVLTVSDADNFTASGGMIQLWLDQGKVRFDINLEVAERESLKVSSKLVKLAKPVLEARK